MYCHNAIKDCNLSLPARINISAMWAETIATNTLVLSTIRNGGRFAELRHEGSAGSAASIRLAKVPICCTCAWFRCSEHDAAVTRVDLVETLRLAALH